MLINHDPNVERLPTILKRLWGHLNLNRRKQFGYLLILMVVASFAEMASIAAIFPFLSLLTKPEIVSNNIYIGQILQTFGMVDSDSFIVFLTLIFIVATILSGVLRYAVLWLSTRLSYAAGTDISVDMYRKTLYQKYTTHISRNSSGIISSITGKSQQAINTIMLLLTALSSLLVLASVLLTLLTIDSTATCIAFGIFGSLYMTLMLLTKKTLNDNGQQITLMSDYVSKYLRESFGAIKDILIDGKQETYIQTYQRVDRLLKKYQRKNQFMGASPRYIMEPLGIVLIAIVAFWVSNYGSGIDSAIPMLGALAMGAQRMLPMLQSLFAAWSGIKSSQATLLDVLELLDQRIPNATSLQTASNPIVFQNAISLRNVCFKYGIDQPYVLKNINLEIAKGSCIGFIGATGSGKSTLLDIVTGLLEPTDGEILVDGRIVEGPSSVRSWATRVSHVPQNIFLADTSIMKNVAFGVANDEIDENRVKEACKLAQLAETIEAWPSKYETVVGEQGVRLSGGQRQRIGLARALYKQADVIILDEATSALDNETERNVMTMIGSLPRGITLLIIAHRVTTLTICSEVIEISQGTVARRGKYSELVEIQNKMA